MTKSPAWFIFIFVSSSIMVASAYNAYVMSPLAHAKAVKAESVSSKNPLWSLAVFPFAANECADENKGRSQVYENELKSFAPIFREARQRGGGDFSFACIQKSSAEHSSFLGARPGACGLKDGPENRSCKNFQGLRVTYNSILDISDCLEISQREILPLLASDSAFLPDLIPEARETDKDDLSTWPQDRAILATSEKPSCRRLAQVLPTDLKIQTGSCPSMRESVFRQLSLARRFQRVSLEIGDKWDASMLDSSLAEMDTRLEDRLILRYWVHLLSQFAGPNKALSLAHEFVSERLDQNTKILPGELSWQGFTSDSSRQPASATGTAWAAFLKKRLEPETMDKLGHVAKWLSWVKLHSLSVECASELWTMD